MGLISGRIKNFLQRRSTAERSGLTLLNLDEAKRWDAARAEGEAAARAKLAAEAVAPQLFTLTTGDGEDPGFRRITSLATLRDLNPLMHDRMLQVCYFLRVTTPFGKRIVEIITNYTVGKGIRVTAKDPRVQEVIDAFWNDEINNMDENCSMWCDELTTFGELCLPVAKNPVSGKVRIGYIDPMNIDTIQFAEMATSDGTASINIPYAVRLRREVGEVLQKPMLLVQRSEDPNAENYGRLAGECFYFTLNKAKSASRGFSELFALADWIDLFDQMIFDFGDKVRFLNSFVWHYTLSGSDAKKVEEYKNKLTKDPPRQGGVMVTNEQVKIEAQTPEFHGQDMASVAQMTKLYGLGGAGLPPTFFGDGVDANRAAAVEMNAPVQRKIQDRQNHLARCLTSVLNFVIESAQDAGVLPPSVDVGYNIEFPEIATRDLEKGAQTLSGGATALQVGQQEGWVTGQTAARAFHTLLSEIGVDIDDSQEEYENAQQEKEDKAAKQQDQFFPQSSLGAALKSLKTPPPNAADEAGKGPDNDLLDADEAKTLVQ
jgi:hypothetical protein